MLGNSVESVSSWSGDEPCLQSLFPFLRKRELCSRGIFNRAVTANSVSNNPPGKESQDTLLLIFIVCIGSKTVILTSFHTLLWHLMWWL